MSIYICTSIGYVLAKVFLLEYDNGFPSFLAY